MILDLKTFLNAMLPWYPDASLGKISCLSENFVDHSLVKYREILEEECLQEVILCP